MAVVARRGAEIRRFLAARVRRNGECLEYTGTRDKHGYGKVELVHCSSLRVVELAHRVAYLLRNGSIGPGQVIRHKCDNPPCINPDHLVSGTQADNVNDMVMRGRGVWARGEQTPNAKLTKAAVEKMREMARSGVPQREISRQFGVSHTTGAKAITGTTWRHVGNE